MKEEPKSIWKKPWAGPAWFHAWVVITVATFFIIASIAAVTSNIRTWPQWRDALLGTFIVAIAVATVTVGLWLFFRWVWCWRNFKKSLFGCACVVTLMAIFYAEEDWRGKRDWENYRRETAANGIKLDWADFIPAPVPDDQNFAMSPVWVGSIKFYLNPTNAEAWYGDRINGGDVDKFFRMLPMSISDVVGTNWVPHPTPLDSPGNWATATMADLKPWQSYYRNLEETNPAAEISITPQPQSPAADVLLALSKFDPVIQELRQDSRLPASRFPIQYDDPNPAEILLPHLAALKQCAMVLQLRAVAELQNGQTAAAFDDVMLTFRLADAIRTEPFIITKLVRFAIARIALQPIYEGLSRHQWTDAQLAALDAALGQMDFPADYKTSIGCETAAHGKLIDWISQKRSRYLTLMGYMNSGWNTINIPEPRERLAGVEIFLMPRGCFYQGNILLDEACQNWLAVLADHPHPNISPSRARQTNKTVETLLVTARPAALSVIGQLLTPQMSGYAERTAYSQTSVDLARVAIALERYHLVHGEFPDSLDALSPQYLEQIPTDIINGEPLHYRRTPDGQFVLYSVGWNETDDGGVAIVKNGQSEGWRTDDIDQGDWVWRYPEK